MGPAARLGGGPCAPVQRLRSRLFGGAGAAPRGVDGHGRAVEQGCKAAALLRVVKHAGWDGVQGSAVGGEGVGLPVGNPASGAMGHASMPASPT